MSDYPGNDAECELGLAWLRDQAARERDDAADLRDQVANHRDALADARAAESIDIDIDP